MTVALSHKALISYAFRRTSQLREEVRSLHLELEALTKSPQRGPRAARSRAGSLPTGVTAASNMSADASAEPSPSLLKRRGSSRSVDSNGGGQRHGREIAELHGEKSVEIGREIGSRDGALSWRGSAFEHAGVDKALAEAEWRHAMAMQEMDVVIRIAFMHMRSGRDVEVQRASFNPNAFIACAFAALSLFLQLDLFRVFVTACRVPC
eukprot:3161892-Pleurochrysis_carterae.AAC.3